MVHKEMNMVLIENTFDTYEDAYVWVRGYVLDKRLKIYLADITYEPQWGDWWSASVRYETRKGA